MQDGWGDPLLYSFFSFLGFQSRLCPPALARVALLGPGGPWKLKKLKKL